MILVRALLTLLALALMPLSLVLNALSLALADLAWKLFGRVRQAPPPGGVQEKGKSGRQECLPHRHEIGRAHV